MQTVTDNPMTKEEFLNCFSIITVNYSQFWLKFSNEEKNRLYIQWRNMCKPYTKELVEQAFTEVCKTCKYFPTFADIYTQICGIKREEEKKQKATDTGALLSYNTEHYNDIKARMIAEKQKKADELFKGKSADEIIKETSAMLASLGNTFNSNISAEKELEKYF